MYVSYFVIKIVLCISMKNKKLKKLILWVIIWSLYLSYWNPNQGTLHINLEWRSILSSPFEICRRLEHKHTPTCGLGCFFKENKYLATPHNIGQCLKTPSYEMCLYLWTKINLWNIPCKTRCLTEESGNLCTWKVSIIEIKTIYDKFVILNFVNNWGLKNL